MGIIIATGTLSALYETLIKRVTSKNRHYKISFQKIKKNERSFILVVKIGKTKPLWKNTVYFHFSLLIFFRIINPKVSHPKTSHYHFWVFHIFSQSLSQNRSSKARSEFLLPLKVPKMMISGSVTCFRVPKFWAPPNEALPGISPPPNPRIVWTVLCRLGYHSIDNNLFFL